MNLHNQHVSMIDGRFARRFNKRYKMFFSMKNICIWEATVYVIHTHNIDRSFGGCDVFNCSFPAFIDLNDFAPL